MSGPIRVLLVDDDADLRHLVAVMLRSEGHHVAEAANGQHALEALVAGPGFGVIVLDLEMPVMDGATFLEHKARGAHAAVPTVIFSSFTPAIGLTGYAGVVAALPKFDGGEALLAAILSAAAVQAG